MKVYVAVVDMGWDGRHFYEVYVTLEVAKTELDKECLKRTPSEKKLEGEPWVEDAGYNLSVEKKKTWTRKYSEHESFLVFESEVKE